MIRKGWSSKQRQMAVIASTRAGWDDAHRYLVMRHCGCQCERSTGEPSVKHERNTQDQFQSFMSFAEPAAASNGKSINPPAEHASWFECVNDRSARLRHRILGLCDEAVRTLPHLYDDQLANAAVRHCAKHDTVGFLPAQPDELSQCDMPTLIRVYECLRAWVGREFAKRGLKPRTFSIPRHAAERARIETTNRRRRKA